MSEHTVFVLACDRSSRFRRCTVDSSSILGNYAVFISFSLSKVDDGEVVLSDCGIIALEPAVVIPLVIAVHFFLHYITNDPTAAIVKRHSPA